MININNMILDTTVFDILKALKLELDMRNIPLLKDMKPTGENIMITCPSHKGGNESRPSCGVHVESGVVHCFTCGYTATMPEFIGFCLDGAGADNFLVGCEWLRRNFMEISIEERPNINLDLSRKALPHKQYTFVPEMVLQQYRFFHPYMWERKLTEDIVYKFDVGYDKKTDCITFPVRDIYGNCLFVARRSVTGKWFNYPSGAEKPLYGIYEWNKAGRANELVVCESIFNCLTCWTHGIPAIALNGTGSKIQIEELQKLPVRSLVLCLDPDGAGRLGIKRIQKQVKNKILYTVNYKDNRDINDLSSDEFDMLMSTKHLL